MKFAALSYHLAESVEHAVSLLVEHGEDAKVLAGGQSLFPLMSLRLSRPEHLIDIGRVANRDAAIRCLPSGEVAIDLGARHVDAERSPTLADRAPLVHAVMPSIGHGAIRSRGTICGSLAHGDPAAELPAVALALGARMTVVGPGRVRHVPAADFFLSTFVTDVQPDEVLTEVTFPAVPPGTGWAFEEVTRRHADYAVVGMVTVLHFDPGSTRVARAALALFSVAATPIRVPRAERLLEGEISSSGLFEAAAQAVVEDTDPPDDVHGTSAYRSHLSRLLTLRTLSRAAQRAGVSL